MKSKQDIIEWLEEYLSDYKLKYSQMQELNNFNVADDMKAMKNIELIKTFIKFLKEN